MANLKEVRNRITSINNTKQITSAMKMVSAAKLRKAQTGLLNFRPYALKLRGILLDITGDVKDFRKYPLLEERDAERVLMVTIASNKGLCGAFNNNVIKATSKIINNQFAAQYESGNLDIMTFGKTVTTFFKKNDYNVIASHDEIFDDLNYNSIIEIVDGFINHYLKKQYDRIELVYNKFKNPAVQVVSTEQLLPVKEDFSMRGEAVKIMSEEVEEAGKRRSRPTGKSSKMGRSIPKEIAFGMKTGKDMDFGDDKIKGRILDDYIYEPNKDTIVNTLIPKALKVQFYKVMLESNASEHGARMTAMHQATENATEIIKDLKLEYNKARQAAITNEIIEIVSGAEALKNG